MNDRLYSMTIKDVEEKFNTNAESGLTQKEADRRRRRGEGGSIYRSVYKSPLAHMAKVGTDITVLIFLLTAFVAVFFDEEKGTLVALVLIFAAYLFSVLTYTLSKRLSESFSELSVPRTRVIRGGKVISVDPAEVVSGDLIVFEKGDVLPCDCRLISSSDLRAVEFVGRIAGKEKKAITSKDAFAVCRAQDKPGIAEQKNMISAAAVVISGGGRGIAVRTGRRTFISLMLGEIEAISPSKNEPAAIAGISRILSKCCLAILISAVPLTVLSMLFGNRSSGILDVLLSLMALAVTGASEIVASLFGLFPSVSQSISDKRKKGAKIKNAAAMQELNYIDSVLLLGSASVWCEDKAVESVYASNRFYSGDTVYSSDDALNCFMDLTLLGTAGYYDLNFVEYEKTASQKKQNAGAVAELAKQCGIDRDKLMSSYEITEFIGGDRGGFDTTLIRRDDEYRVICISDSVSLLGLCTHIRTPEGAQPFDNDKKSDIVRACSQLAKKAKDVMLVASRISPCSSLSRLGAVQNQLIFEGYTVFTAPYTDSCADRVFRMKEADISVFLAAPENAESVITAFNIGVVKSKHEIAYASAFLRDKKSITDGFGQYKAYLGFTAKELETLAKHIRGEDGTLAVIASSADDIAVMKQANLSAALMAKETGDAKSYHYPEILRKNADILLPVPDRSGGGFEAFCTAVTDSKSCITGMGKFLKYISFSLALRAVITVLSLILGNPAFSAVHLAFLGAFIDIPMAFVFAFSKNCDSFGDRIEDIESDVSKPFKKLAKYIVVGGILGLLTVMLASVFKHPAAESSSLTVFCLISAVLLQLFAAFVILHPKTSDRMGRKIFPMTALVPLVILILALSLSGVGALLEVGYPGWHICIAAPLISVIGYVMILVSDRYI